MWRHAINEFEQAVAINPWEPKFKVHLCRAYLAGGIFNKALVVGEAAVNQAPMLPEALLALALTLDRKGETAKAVKWFNKCLALKPEDYIAKEAREHIEFGAADDRKKFNQ